MGVGFRGAEPQGYLAGTQARDGVIHLISSWNHYAFNVAWLKEGGAVGLGWRRFRWRGSGWVSAGGAVAGLDARKGRALI